MSIVTLAEIVPPTSPTRRIVLELSDDRAIELARAINGIDWRKSPARDELQELHEALGGWR